MTIKIISPNTDIPFEYYNSLLHFISDERKSKIKSFKSNSQKVISLFAELMIKSEVSEKFGLSYDEIFFEYNKYGKPSVKGLPNYHFSLSHSDDFIAFTDSENIIGIDIEPVRKCNLKIAKRFFTEQEYQYIVNSNNIDETFFRIWTAKEAYVKMIGKGISYSFRKFNVLESPISYHKYKDCIIAVCTSK